MTVPLLLTLSIYSEQKRNNQVIPALFQPLLLAIEKLNESLTLLLFSFVCFW